MNYYKFSLLTLSALSSLSCYPQASGSKRTNVLFFLADDLGWADLSCYGSTFYETPNLDQLAKEGMMFTNAYAACPVSSPTRVSFQTGKYPARVGVTDYIKGRYHTEKNKEEMQRICPVLPPDNLFNMPASEFTIAEVLKENGYSTAHVGKWHCSEDSLLWPEHQGYDINIAGCGKGSPSNKGYFVPYNNPRLKDGAEGEYLTDRLGNECVNIIRQFKDKPFFINMSFYQVHTPLIGKQDKVAYFIEKAKQLGLDTISCQFEENPLWSQKQPFKRKKWGERIVQNHAVYAAMVSSMDENIGKIISELKQQGIYDNTIIIFTSDNGGLSTAEGSPTSNLPLKAGKGHMYEGGIREPLIVRWKDVVKRGSCSEMPVTTVDYYPTILEMLGLQLPENITFDGISIVPELKGKQQTREAIFWHYPHYPNQGGRPAGAIRKDNYKLIQFFDDNTIELYDVVNDISETNDLSRINSKLAQQMLNKLQHWQKNIGAKTPTENMNYNH